MKSVPRKTDMTINLINIDRITLKGSYQDMMFVELNYFENSGVWQVTDVHGGWCGTFLFNPRHHKNAKIKAFRKWITLRNQIEKINLNG